MTAPGPTSPSYSSRRRSTAPELCNPLAQAANCRFGIDTARPELLAVWGRSILDTMSLADAVLGSRNTFVQPRPPRSARRARMIRNRCSSRCPPRPGQMTCSATLGAVATVPYRTTACHMRAQAGLANGTALVSSLERAVLRCDPAGRKVLSAPWGAWPDTARHIECSLNCRRACQARVQIHP